MTPNLCLRFLDSVPCAVTRDRSVILSRNRPSTAFAHFFPMIALRLTPKRFIARHRLRRQLAFVHYVYSGKVRYRTYPLMDCLCTIGVRDDSRFAGTHHRPQLKHATPSRPFACKIAIHEACRAIACGGFSTSNAPRGHLGSELR
jgi:hypothetical protein